MSDLHHLPPLEPGIRPLSDVEADEMRRRAPEVERHTVANCLTCGGTGTFRWYSLDRSEVWDWECPCRDQWVLHRYLTFAGVPLVNQRHAWADVVDHQGLQTVVDWVSDADSMRQAGIGLLISGGPGKGKTLLSTLVLKRLLARGWRGRYVTAEDLTSGWRACWGDAEAQGRWRRFVTSVDVLVVDRLGDEITGESGASKVTVGSLREALSFRTSACLPTVVALSSRYDPDKAASVYAEADFGSFIERATVAADLSPASDHGAAWRDQTQADHREGLRRPVVIE